MKNKVNKIIFIVYKFILGETPTSVASNFINNLTFAGVGFAISAGLGLIIQVLAGRILGPLEYGKYFLIQSISSFISIFMLCGIPIAMVKYLSEKDDLNNRKAIISTSCLLLLSLSIFFILVLFAFLGVLSGILNTTKELFIYAIIFSLFYSIYTMLISVVQGIKEIKYLSLLQTIYGITGITAFCLFIFFGLYSFKSVFFSSLINYFIVSIFVIIIFRKYFFIDFDIILARKIIIYGFYASIGTIASIILLNFDRIVINKIIGASSVGVYSSYYTAFITPSLYIFSVFNLVFFPAFSGIRNKEMIFKKINKALIRLVVPILLFIFSAGVIIVFLYGSRYQFNLQMCILFTISSIFILLNSVYMWCMNATGKKGVWATSLATSVSAIINVILNIILIPIIGISGGVLSMIFSCIASVCIIYSKRHYYRLSLND